MNERKSFWNKLLNLIGGTGNAKPIPDSDDFLSKYSAIESNVKTYRKEETLNEQKTWTHNEDADKEISLYDHEETSIISNKNDGMVEDLQDASSTLTKGGYKFCPFCGSKNDGHYKFCSNCGTPNPLISSGTTIIEKKIMDAKMDVPLKGSHSNTFLNEDVESTTPKKRNAGAVIERVVLYLVLIMLLVGGSFGGYYYYMQHNEEKYSVLAQKAIINQKWDQASDYLTDAIEQNDKIAHFVSVSDQEAMKQWQEVSDILKINLPVLQHSSGHIKSLTDYRNAFNKIDQIEWNKLRIAHFGKLDAEGATLGTSLFIDSLRVSTILSFVENLENYRYDFDKEIIYELTSLDSISVKTELLKVVNRDNPLTNSFKNSLKEVSSRVRLSNIPRVDSISAGQNSTERSIPTVVAPLKPVKKTEENQKSDRNYD